MYSYNQLVQNTTLHGNSGIELGLNHKLGKSVDTNIQQLANAQQTKTSPVSATHLDYHLSNLLHKDINNIDSVSASSNHQSSLDTCVNTTSYNCVGHSSKQHDTTLSLGQLVPGVTHSSGHFTTSGQTILESTNDSIQSCHGSFWMDNCLSDKNKLR